MLTFISTLGYSVFAKHEQLGLNMLRYGQPVGFEDSCEVAKMHLVGVTALAIPAALRGHEYEPCWRIRPLPVNSLRRHGQTDPLQPGVSRLQPVCSASEGWGLSKTTNRMEAKAMNVGLPLANLKGGAVITLATLGSKSLP